MNERRRGASRLVIAGVMAMVALGACHDGGSATRASSTGRPAAAPPTDSASTTQAGAEPCTFSGASAAAHGGDGAATHLLTDVRVGVHDCFERVTFEFKPMPGDGAGPVSWKVAYEPGPITEDGSGRPVAVKGASHLVVHLSAQSADLTKADAPPTYTGPTSLQAAGATRIQQVRRTGDFEGYITWVIGLDKARPFKVTTGDDPSRVIVDVGD
jgi:hypothetical protein